MLPAAVGILRLLCPELAAYVSSYPVVGVAGHITCNIRSFYINNLEGLCVQNSRKLDTKAAMDIRLDAKVATSRFRCWTRRINLDLSSFGGIQFCASCSYQGI